MHKIKRELATLLIVGMSINSFGAVVSDNDGSAFVTKAEFDALKASFNKQIDDYNSSIDGKIDGAIASYLAGIAVDTLVEGENYIRKMNGVRNVTFWSPSATTINASGEANIYRRYMWKYFGAFYSPYARRAAKWKDSTGANIEWNSIATKSYYSRWATKAEDNNADYIDGSFLLDLFSYTHSREFEFQTKGNAGNAFYQVKERTFGGDDYISLESDTTYTVTEVCGGYYVHGDLVAKDWKTLFPTADKFPATYSFIHRNEVLPFTTNSFEPGNINVDLKIGNYTQSMPGATFNVWMKNKNAVVDCNFLYDFTNTPYATDKTLVTFTNESFLDWTREYTFVGTKRTAGDWWMSFVGENGTYRRVYTWQNLNYQIVAGGMVAIPVDNEKGTMKVMQPDFKSYTSEKIINDLGSSQIGSPVYPYSGAPLTSVPKKVTGMTATLDVKVYDATETLKSGVGYDVVLSKEPFTNVNTDTIITTGDTDKVKIFKNTTGTNYINISLDSTFLTGIPEGTVLYIRIVPEINKSDYHICVDCSEVRFSVEA